MMKWLLYGVGAYALYKVIQSMSTPRGSSGGAITDGTLDQQGFVASGGPMVASYGGGIITGGPSTGGGAITGGFIDRMPGTTMNSPPPPRVMSLAVRPVTTARTAMRGLGSNQGDPRLQSNASAALTSSAWALRR